MNLIDLYNKNPNGKVQRIDDGYVKIIDFSNYDNFLHAIYHACHGDVSNTADDWEIVKVQRKIVIDSAKHDGFYSGRGISDGGMNLLCDDRIPRNVPLKVTVEWEE